MPWRGAHRAHPLPPPTLAVWVACWPSLAAKPTWPARICSTSRPGEYNVSYLKQYLAGRGIVLVHLAGRVQGLIVPPGNPKGFAGLADLARPDVLFVNRQRGSGTRVLLDYQLGLLGIPAPDDTWLRARGIYPPGGRG